MLGARMHYGHPDIMNKLLGEKDHARPVKTCKNTFQHICDPCHVIPWTSLMISYALKNWTFPNSTWMNDCLTLNHLERGLFPFALVQGSSWCSREACPKLQRPWTFQRTFSQASREMHWRWHWRCLSWHRLLGQEWISHLEATVEPSSFWASI